jgi:hypothetical protein
MNAASFAVCSPWRILGRSAGPVERIDTWLSADKISFSQHFGVTMKNHRIAVIPGDGIFYQ